jgi:PKD repeat protein
MSRLVADESFNDPQVRRTSKLSLFTPFRRPVLATSLFAVLLAAVVVVGVSCAVASAASPTLPYGVVSRFGGFDETPTPAKFVDPVGFAVAPEEDNDVYVLDRVKNGTTVNKSGETVGVLDYRLQKFSSAGAVLGSVTLPPFEYPEYESYKGANPMIGLAVDSQEHRVYALVETIINSAEPGEEGQRGPVAQRLVAWSTQPNEKEELVKATGEDGHEYSEDPLTHAALIAGASVLQAGEPDTDLYDPAGIAIAPNHEVVIEAQQGVLNGNGGPAILQSVSTTYNSNKPEGTLGAAWVNTTYQGADGLFATAGGSFGVDLFAGYGEVPDLVTVNSGLSSATPFAEYAAGRADLDQAPASDARHTINYNDSYDNPAILDAYTAGPPITQLSNGLYAALYAEATEDGPPKTDSQTHQDEPWVELSTFWYQGDEGTLGVGNVGVRLFDADGAVVTTIGGNAACKLETPQLAVAAGSEESLFVLTQPNPEDGNAGDEVIEFKPGFKAGSTGACPDPVTGSPTVNGQSGSVVKVTQMKEATFDAIGIDLEGESPYSFEWYFEGGEIPASKTFAPGSEMQPSDYLWPTPEAKHTYKKAGTYEAAVKVTGDYGSSVFPVTVKVEPTSPAVAVFTTPSAVVAEQAALFNAEESTPTPESRIFNYRWEFGDETPVVNTSSAVEEHTFAKAGVYHVKLKITDESGESASIEHEVTVTAPAAKQSEPGGGTSTNTGTNSNTGTNTNSGTNTNTNTGTGTGSTAPPSSSSPPLSTPLTTLKPKPTLAQELAKALAQCKKIKAKGRRVSCEKAAKAKYEPKKKTNKRVKHK